MICEKLSIVVSIGSSSFTMKDCESTKRGAIRELLFMGVELHKHERKIHYVN